MERMYDYQKNWQDSDAYDDTSMKNSNDSKYGFWGALARKAKSILEDDNSAEQHEDSNRNQSQHEETTENQLGLSIVEDRTANIIQETRKLNLRRNPSYSNMRSQAAYSYAHQHNISHVQADQETQLKAAQDVANAMAAKAKLLMRELKTVKADLAFAKDRCAQLEEENRILRESRGKGNHLEDDDLIRLQLETLLAEKARLALENSMHTRENRFLREIVEYHQLTMQDVVFLDEGIEEVSEVYPISSSYSSIPAGRHSGSPNPWISSPSNSAVSLPIPVPPASATRTSAIQPF